MILLIITMIFMRPDGTVSSADHFVQHEPSWVVCAENRRLTMEAAEKRPDKKGLLITARCEHVELRRPA